MKIILPIFIPALTLFFNACSYQNNFKVTSIVKPKEQIADKIRSIKHNLNKTNVSLYELPDGLIFSMIIGIDFALDNNYSTSTSDVQFVKSNGKIRILGDMNKSGGGECPAYRYLENGVSIIYPTKINQNLAWVEIIIQE
jgi:hypothetical protein